MNEMVKIMADKEKLSALMDGESVDQGLLAELAHDAEGQKSWQNYHLIGDVMRGENPVNAEWDIAGKVALALEDEPAHHITPIPAVEAQPTPREARRAMPSWLAQFGQVAMAACVSLAVILGVQQYGGVEGDPAQAELPVLQTIPFAGSAEPVSLTANNQSSSSEAQLMEQRRRVNALLQDYNLQLRLNSKAIDDEANQLESVVE